MPNSWLNAAVSSASFCETPTSVTPLCPYALYSRSKNGRAYWHVGHDTLKNTITTGPRASSSLSETRFPSKVFNSNSGALVPIANALIHFSLDTIPRRQPYDQLDDPKARVASID